MIKEYFILMWRKTMRNKSFTFINIFGLSVGIAVFILITIWIQNEFSYDKFNKNIDNIYRIEIGGSVYMVSAIAQSFKNEFPEIEKAVRFSGVGSSLLTENEKSIMIDNAILADSTLFDIFTYEFIYGNPKDALVTPFSIVLSESTARTLFDANDPVGKSVKINNQFEATVTGVFKDVSKTHMPVDALASFVTLGKVNPQPDYLHSFGTSQYPTYFLIKEGVDIAKLAEKMTEFTNDLFVKNGGTAEGNENQLVPLKDIYFHNVHFPILQKIVTLLYIEPFIYFFPRSGLRILGGFFASSLCCPPQFFEDSPVISSHPFRTDQHGFVLLREMHE
jgi:putative ABC transport system permease protein